MTSPRFSEESGFTLIEMIVCITMLAVIIVPLTGAILVGLVTTDDTQATLNTSSGRQLLAVHLEGDVRSATDVADTDAPGPVTSGCAEADPGSHVLRLGWSETWTATVPPTWVTTSYTAEYRLVEVSPPGITPLEHNLVRLTCTNGGTATTNTVAQSLHAAIVERDETTGEVTVTLTDSTGDVYAVSAIRRIP